MATRLCTLGWTIWWFEYVSYILGHLSTWLIANDTLWVGLGGMALLEKACHWGQDLRIQRPCMISSILCLFLLVIVHALLSSYVSLLLPATPARLSRSIIPL